MDSAFLTCEGNMDVKLGSGVVDSRRNIVIAKQIRPEGKGVRSTGLDSWLDLEWNIGISLQHIPL